MVNLLEKPSPPTFSSEPIMNGPSMSIGVVPATKSASCAPDERSAAGLAMPFWKKLW